MEQSAATETTRSIEGRAAPESGVQLVAPALSFAEAVAIGRGLVDRLARRFARYGGDFDDLRQEGFLALLTCARSWCIDGGASFLTWISRSVRKAMGRALTRERRGGLTGRRQGRLSYGGRDDAQALGFSVGRTRSMDAAVETSDERSMHDVLGVAATAERDACDADARAKIGACVARMDERDRAIWTMSNDGATTAEVGAHVGMGSSHVSWRLAKLHDDLAAAVESGATTVPGEKREPRSQQLTHDGMTMTIPAWGRRVGLAPRIIRKRLATGWSVADALTKPITAAKRTHGKAA